SKSTPTPVSFMDPKNICICPINQMSEYFNRIRMVTPPSLEVESPIHGILDPSTNLSPDVVNSANHQDSPTRVNSIIHTLIESPNPVIDVITGPPGEGKTELAANAIHRELLELAECSTSCQRKNRKFNLTRLSENMN